MIGSQSRAFVLGNPSSDFAQQDYMEIQGGPCRTRLFDVACSDCHVYYCMRTSCLWDLRQLPEMEGPVLHCIDLHQLVR